MSLFHRDDKEPQVGRIDEDMASASAEDPQMPPPAAEPPPPGTEPLEESIDEPPPIASRYLASDDWTTRSRRRLNEQVADTCESCDAFVQRKPWQSVGIAALSGAFLALLLSRR